jgi:hypothetical protein
MHDQTAQPGSGRISAEHTSAIRNTPLPTHCGEPDSYRARLLPKTIALSLGTSGRHDYEDGRNGHPTD